MDAGRSLVLSTSRHTQEICLDRNQSTSSLESGLPSTAKLAQFKLTDQEHETRRADKAERTAMV